MAPSITVPQDIIDEIVINIYDDLTSLKACSLAARPFYQPTRRHIFAAIILNHPDTVASLDRTLALNPRLSVYIRSLEILSLLEATISKIVPVLPALSQTRRLVLGVRKLSFDAYILPSEVFPVLSCILQLPLLETLEIFSIRGFPTPLLHIPHRLKYLTLWNLVLALRNLDPTTQPLLQLKDIHLYHIRKFRKTSGINAPNLRRVIIGKAPDDIQTIMETSAQSIETMVWDGCVCRQSSPLENLTKMLQNLRHLCVIVSGNKYKDNASYLIHKILIGDGLAGRLERFTFVVGKARHDGVSVPVLGFMSLGNIWQDFANRVQFPKLKNVTIHLVNEGRNLPPIDPETFHILVSQELPLLEETGLLQTTVCKELDLDDLL